MSYLRNRRYTVGAVALAAFVVYLVAR
jgi:hypothetical protein